MNNFNTHIIRNLGSERSELIRAKDGMIIACRQGSGVVFGEDPNVNVGTRHFMDDTYAKAFLRRLADIDLTRRTPCPKCGDTKQLNISKEVDKDIWVPCSYCAKPQRDPQTARIEEIDGERRIHVPNGVQ